MGTSFESPGDYSSEPTFLVNRAAADYYGLDTIIALDERPQSEHLCILVPITLTAAGCNISRVLANKANRF